MSTLARAAGPRLRASYWLAAAALAVLGTIAADAWLDRPGQVAASPALGPAELLPGFGPRSFDEALANADRALAGARERLARDDRDWLYMEGVARALAARHRLTADAADLAEADRLLDRALDRVPWPAGPALTRAEVSLSVHDLDAAEAALARFDASAVPAPAEELAAALSLRCEIAFQRGDLTQARRLCSGGDGIATALRRANLAAKTGDTAEAARIVEALLRRPGHSPQTLAVLSLQRASMALAEGDWQASGRWARAADRAFPGYWLSEAYLAQQAALEGDRAEARRRYAALAERTGNADVLDALARLAQADGRDAEAERWASEAGAAWDARARLLPDAYAIHHAEHLLLNGDPQAALARAEADHLRRPYPGTIAHFGYALWRNGRHARALEVVREGEGRGFLTAEMKLVEALALGSLGRASEAGEALAEARRLNPRIDSSRQQFVVFGRD